MKFYQLGFRYLQRKKGKTILPLIVLILVNSMILGTSMILRTTNESKQAMQENFTFCLAEAHKDCHLFLPCPHPHT